MKLNTVLEQTVPGLGYELVDVEIAPSKLIRVYIDKEGGITIEDCELVSNHLSKLLLVEEIDFNRLEVSSPGVERPLKKIEDFLRFSGRMAKVKTRELIDGQKVFQGIINSVDGNMIILGLADGQVVNINFSTISRARLIFEYNKTKAKG
jgi:ribosome maturation factor RimP